MYDSNWITSGYTSVYVNIDKEKTTKHGSQTEIKDHSDGLIMTA